MSDASKGAGGAVGALLTVVGIGSTILLPFYLVWRFGIAHIALMMALVGTVIAIFREDWLVSIGDSGGPMIHAFLGMPWLVFSVVNWVLYALCLVALAANTLPSVLAGRNMNQ